MTGLLRDLMDERAEQAFIPQLDLDAIIQTGDKRVRRRKVVAGVGVAAVAAAVVAAFAIAPGIVDQNSEQPPAVQQPEVGSFTELRPTYGVGSTIFYGNDQLTVEPHTMRSLVQNDYGFAFVTTDGEVFFTDGRSTEQIGDRGIDANTGDVQADGQYVAWVDYTPDRPELVVYDASAGEEVVRTDQDSLAGQAGRDEANRGTMIGPVDGGIVYWHNSTGFVATNASTGETTTIAENAFSDYIKYVENGVFSYVTDAGGVVGVGPDRVSGEEPYFQGERGALSPSGTRVFVTDIEGNAVYDVASEADVTPSMATSGDIFVNWLDDDSYTVMRADGVLLDFMQCSITDDACTMLQRNVADFSDVVWPTGQENGAK